MSYKIEKAKQLLNDISSLEKSLTLNENALEAAKEAKASRSTIDEFTAKTSKLQKKLVRARKKYSNYADENLKPSDLPKVLGEKYEEDLDEYFYDE